MSDRFPCIDFAGQYIWTGHVDVYRTPIAGGALELIEQQASGPKVLADGRVVFSRNAPGTARDGAVLVYDFGAQIYEMLPPGLEGWSAHNGLFASWRREDRLKALTRSTDGHTAGLVDLLGISGLEVDGVEIDRGPLYDPRYTGGTLVWSKIVNGQRRTFGRLRHGAPTEDLTVLATHEFWPIAIDTPLGPWVLNHGDEHCFVRPWGPQQYHGHIVRVGVTDRPDARVLPNGLLLVAFSDGRNLQREFIDLEMGATEDVRRPVSTPDPDPDPDPDPEEPIEETPVQLEAKHSTLIEAFAVRFPPPGGNEDELRDDWTPHLVEQFVFSFPNEGWGWKSTSQGSRPSSDVIARRTGGKIWGYDLIVGAGTSGWRLTSNAGPMDLSSQAFIEMRPVNHLGAVVDPDPDPDPDPEPDPDPNPPPVDLRPVLQRLDTLTALVQQLLARPTADVQAVQDNVSALRTFVEHTQQGKLLVLDNKLDQLLARREPERCRSRFGLSGDAD